MFPEAFIGLQVLQLFWLIGLSLATWLRRPGEEATRAAQSAAQSAELLRGRVDVLEERLKHMPSLVELSRVEGTVRSIQATLQGMNELQAAVRATVTRIESYLHARP